MLQVSIDFTDGKFALKTLKQINKNLSKLNIDDLARVSQLVAQGFLIKKANTERSYWTGNLLKGIYPIYQGRNFKLIASAFSEDGYDYANIVEYGNEKVKSIRPKHSFVSVGGKMTKSKLIWQDYAKGWHMSDSVNVPQGKRFMRSTRDWLRRTLGKYAENRIKTMIRSDGKMDGWGEAYRLR